MASTPGQTSGAMLTLLLESQLAFALLPTPAPLPAGLQGAPGSNKPTAESLVLRLLLLPWPLAEAP